MIHGIRKFTVPVGHAERNCVAGEPVVEGT